MPVIYLDVLLAQNLYINYFLLRACARLSHTPLHRGRCLLAAIGSSFFACYIFLPPLPFWIQLLLKLIAAAASVILAFGIQRVMFLRQLGWFLVCSFLLAGLLLAIGSCARKGFAIWGNSVCYLDFSLLQLILFTTLAYFLLRLITFWRSRKLHTDDQYQIFFRMGEKVICLSGLADTGNTLVDPFSGLPVIVCAEKALSPLLQGKPICACKGYRLLPCTTVHAQELMPLFQPDEICVRSLSTGRQRTASAMVGVGGTQTQAIFHPKLIL